MNRYSFETFYKLPLKAQVTFLIEKKIFEIRDSDDEVYINENDKINSIIESSLFKPNPSYLDGIYQLMMKQLEPYVKGLKTEISEDYFKEVLYEEKLEFSSSLKEHKKIAKKLRKKIIKSIKHDYFPFIIDLIPYRTSFMDDFKTFWFNTDVFLQDENLVNKDVLMYATGSNDTESEFDCRCLDSFIDLIKLVSLYNALDYFNDEIKKLNSITEDDYSFIENIKYNVKNNINRYDQLFSDPVMCELFMLCIKKENKVNARTLNIYWYIFNIQNYRRNYQGVDTEFISFCKNEFDIQISRVEKDIPRNIDLEMERFKNNVLLISSYLQDL